MATMDTTLTIKVDASELESAIAKMRASIDPRTRCSIDGCTEEGLLKNHVRLSLDTPGSPMVNLYLCDDHYNGHDGYEGYKHLTSEFYKDK